MVVVWSIPNGLWWWYGQFQRGYGGGSHVQCIAWWPVISSVPSPLYGVGFGVCRMMVDNLDVYNVQCCEVVHFYWVYYLVSSSSDVTLLLDFCRMPLSWSGNLLQSLRWTVLLQHTGRHREILWQVMTIVSHNNTEHSYQSQCDNITKYNYQSWIYPFSFLHCPLAAGGCLKINNGRVAGWL